MSGFSTFDDYLAIPRVLDLTLSPDGARLVATVSQLNADGDAFVPALWELDPAGAAPARQLTRPPKGDGSATFAADGSLLFVSARDGDDEPAALWRLPAVGEPERVQALPGGVDAVVAAADADVAVFSASVLPAAASIEDDERLRKDRKTIKTAAVLWDRSPVRYWDHDLGPDELRLFTTGEDTPRDLTPAPGRALDEGSFAVSPDGTTVVTTWNELPTPGFPHAALVAIDVAGGERRVLAQGTDVGFGSPAFSPDGRYVIAVKSLDCTDSEPWTQTLWLHDLRTGEGRDVLADPDVWPASPVFGTDAGTVFFVADEQGHAPVFRLDVASGEVTRLTASGHHTALRAARDGSALYALRDTWDSPPRPVRIDPVRPDAEPTFLPAPGEVDVPGTLQRVSSVAEDGTDLGAWLVLPDGASESAPAPLVLFVHGGPFSSWNAWTWRWNPWLLAARGYAVLLPDPALSTGYGVQMLRRGWRQWGGNPYTDLMAVTDTVVARPDIDDTRTAAMGGSYGGYMANWIAGHTDRFRCIVTHASLWDMTQFAGTTDMPGDWALEWGHAQDDPEHFARWSPSTHADAITTPMLVVHGDRDYRVPVGEGLRLWWDLQRRGVPSRFLYYPDEGHWVLKPGNARLWYETVWAWLAQHVLDEPWQRPELV